MPISCLETYIFSVFCFHFQIKNLQGPFQDFQAQCTKQLTLHAHDSDSSDSADSSDSSDSRLKIPGVFTPKCHFHHFHLFQLFDLFDLLAKGWCIRLRGKKDGAPNTKSAFPLGSI